MIMTTASTELPTPTREAKAPSGPAEAAPAARRSPKKALLILGGVLAIALSSTGAYSWSTRGQETTDDAQIDTDVVPLGARVGGTLAEVFVRDNQEVNKGDPIVALDPADYDVKVKKAEAELEAARAQAAAADAGVRIAEASSKGGLSTAKAVLTGSAEAVASARAQIDAAKAAVARAEAEAQRAETDRTRLDALAKSGSVAQATLDEAEARHSSAQAALAQARAQLVVAEEGKRVAASRVEEARGRLEQSAPIDAQISSAEATAALAHARVKSAEAALAQAKLERSYTTIVAPASGVVSRLGVRPGQIVQPGQLIADLVPRSTYVIANFKETQVGAMKPGAPAEIEIDALPGQRFEGRVESLSGGTGARFSLLPPENATGNFVKVVQRVPVRIEWVHPPEGVTLRAGLSAEVTVHTR